MELAVIAEARSSDFDAADDLFKIALKQLYPAKGAQARTTAACRRSAKRLRDAQEVLDQAVKERP